MLVSELFLQHIVLILYLLLISSSILFEIFGNPYKKLFQYSSSMLLVYRHFHRQPTTIRKLFGKLNQTGSVHDIQQRSSSRVATRGQDHYIVLNQLRVRCKSITPTARQTNVFISYDQCIILGEHLELLFSEFNEYVCTIY